MIREVNGPCVSAIPWCRKQGRSGQNACRVSSSDDRREDHNKSSETDHRNQPFEFVLMATRASKRMLWRPQHPDTDRTERSIRVGIDDALTSERLRLRRAKGKRGDARFVTMPP